MHNYPYNTNPIKQQLYSKIYKIYIAYLYIYIYTQTPEVYRFMHSNMQRQRSQKVLIQIKSIHLETAMLHRRMFLNLRTSRDVQIDILL